MRYILNNYIGDMWRMKIYGVMARKGVPKRDGSGGGTRKNKGRGGCAKPRKSGRGR